MGRLIVAVVLMAGCGAPDAEAPVDGQPPSDGAFLDRPGGPASLADVAPGDTAGMLALMRAEIRSGDQAASALVPRDTTLEAGENLEPRRLRLWLQDGRPIKLLATEPNTTDRFPGETVAWFRLGELAVVQRTAGVFLLDGDGIVFTADESLVPVTLDEALRMQIERELVDSVKARLAVFGVAYP